MPPSSPLSVRKPISLRSLWLSYSRNPTLTLSFFIVGILGTIFGTVSVFHSIFGEKCKGFEPRSVKVTFESSSSSSLGGGALLASPEAPRIGEVERHKVMGFVGIQTGFGSVGRRRSLRKTWMPANREGLKRLEEATGLAFRFVIGRTGDSLKMEELRKEIEEYDDFMLLDIEEEYNNLPRKTLAFFKAAYRLYDADFYVKADDDIYLRPDRLSSLLAKERSHPLTYLGCMKKGPVFTDPKLKWYEPLSYLLGSEYFLHAYGPIYALSAEVVNGLVAIKTDSFRLFSNEDVTIGVWMLAMNVNHETDWSLCQPACTQSSVAVWDIPKCSGLCNPEVQLLNLHKMESCSGIISQ